MVFELNLGPTESGLGVYSGGPSDCGGISYAKSTKPTDPNHPNQKKLGANRSVVIFDIDGTLADNGARLRYIKQDPKPFSGWKPDWDKFHSMCGSDRVIQATRSLLQLIASTQTVFLVTGRPNSVRQKTIDWLNLNGIAAERLYMREDGDHRQAPEFKLGVLKSLRQEGFTVSFVVEDEPKVVAMWRENGVTCFQVESPASTVGVQKVTFEKEPAEVAKGGV